MKKGLFIVFEGIDGSGKTTQAEMLASALSGEGYRVLATREPGGTALGEDLRNVLLYGAGPVDPVAEALLYGAARAQLVSERIMPALGEGAVVICDRFADSMAAYQGWGKGLDSGFLDAINRYACRGLVPDTTVLIDTDPALAMARLTGPADRMEREGPEFLQRVRKGYMLAAEKNPERYLVLDGSLPADKLFVMVRAGLDSLLGEWQV
ncbi:MAG: dTMP kinase [Bacillota bacterium]